MNKNILIQKENVRKSLEKLIEVCKKEQMTNSTIEEFKKGKTIIDCKYCKTPNMVEVHKEKKYTMYECLKCSKTYMEKFKWSTK